MYQQQKKRAGRRGQRRMPVDLETPNAFAARKCTDAATPRPLRGRPSAAPPPPFVRTLHARSRWAGRAIADVALRAVCGSLSRAKRRTERTTRCREREARNCPPPGGALRQGPSAARTRSPHFSLHSSLHSTARNLQLGARIATRNPQLASKRGRPMHPRAPKMRLISVQMFHVKHSDLNLRFRMRDAHRRAAIHPSDAARCEPSHLLPQPIALRAQRTSSLAHRAHCARPDASRTATPRARHTPPTPSSRPSRLSAIPAGHPRHRTCPPSPRIVREAAADNLPTPRPNRSPQAKDQALSRDRCRNPRGGAAARTCSP